MRSLLSREFGVNRNEPRQCCQIGRSGLYRTRTLIPRRGKLGGPTRTWTWRMAICESWQLSQNAPDDLLSRGPSAGTHEVFQTLLSPWLSSSGKASHCWMEWA